VPYPLWATVRLVRRLEEAERIVAKSLQMKRRVFGDDHVHTLEAARVLATVYDQMERDNEAEPLYVEAIEGLRRLYGDDHERTLRAMSQLGRYYMVQDRHDAAERLLTRVVEGQVGYGYYGLACIAAKAGWRDDSIRFLREAVNAGYGYESILDDDDLNSLRGDPEFEAIVEELKRRNEKKSETGAATAEAE
jgi:hypothetical protein